MTGATDTAAPVAPMDDLAGNAYPAMLRELGDTVARQLADVGVDQARAEAIGTTVAEHVRELYGGQLVYIPRGASYETRQRWLTIWQEFTGHNHADLARKHGMNIKQVYRVLAIVGAEMRKRKEAVENLNLFLQKASSDTPPDRVKAARDTVARMEDVI